MQSLQAHVERTLLWIGRQRALVAVPAFWGGSVAFAATLPQTEELWAFAVLALLFCTYCRLRPSQRSDVFVIATLPACSAALAHDILGIPAPIVGIPFALIALALARDVDRRDLGERAA